MSDTDTDTDTDNTPEAEAAFVDILVTVLGGPRVALMDVATEEIDPEEELAQAIAAARADDCWNEDTEDAWTADDAVQELEDRLAAALASADTDSSGRDFLDTEAYQLAVADAASYSTPDPEWLRLLQDADQISLTQPAGVGPDFRKYQHTYWTVLARAREAIEPEMRKVRAHFANIAPDGCGDLEQDPSDASFVHVFGALAPQAQRLAGCKTEVYAGLAAAWAD